MRFLASSAALAALFVTLGDVRSSQATEGPWCAETSLGRNAYENCSMRSFEMCRQEVSIGGRCFRNPHYQPDREPSPARKKQRAQPRY